MTQKRTSIYRRTPIKPRKTIVVVPCCPICGKDIPSDICSVCGYSPVMQSTSA